MKEEVKIAINNIRIACEEFKGTRKEHIALEQFLNLITKELNSCNCKITKEEELKNIVNKDN